MAHHSQAGALTPPSLSLHPRLRMGRVNQTTFLADYKLPLESGAQASSVWGLERTLVSRTGLLDIVGMTYSHAKQRSTELTFDLSSS